MNRPPDGDRVPFFFGPPGRRLFGFYHGPAGDGSASLAVLVCSPLGREHLDSHRCLHYLAGQLAALRCAVMRFDYYGTGDSEGAGPDVTLSGLLTDTGTAMDELCRRAGTRDVMLVGLRAGATVACLLRSDGVDAELRKLVLWDAFSDSVPKSRRLSGNEAWARGYAYQESFLQALRRSEIALGELAGVAGDTLIVETQDCDVADELERLFNDRHGRAEVARFPAVPFFSKPGVVPFNVVKTIVGWATS